MLFIRNNKLHCGFLENIPGSFQIQPDFPEYIWELPEMIPEPL